jgi:type I restriction enzyme, S subunit
VSHIANLIREFCPNGVEFAMLRDVVRIRNGKEYKSLGEGDVPVYGTGGIMTYVDTAAYDKPSVLIPRKGSLNKLYYVDVPFWTVDTIFYTEIGERVVPKFLYYFLLTQHLEEMNQAGGVPSLTQTALNPLRIPVPPLEVQREIVRVLDLFGELEADLATKLDAEFQARRLQYAYYRDYLFAFRNIDGVKRVPMGEVGSFIRGRRFTKDDFVETGIPCIHYGEIYTTYGIAAAEAVSHVREDLAPQLRYANPGDVVIAAVGETVEDVGRAVAWLGTTDVAIHDDCFLYRSDVLEPKFVSHYLRTDVLNREKAKYVARAKVKRLSGENLAKLVIPLPSLDEQKRVVAILDEFEALVTGISAALPAESFGRRKQYEYYRDRLLTFKELTA